ncbi:hypothetical protein HOS57_gp25 [Streptomyces phage AbbeyMikolon]|uniref:Uncharacterized protein n=1 Tax=Streptomyces phage AbbeyMikolon TaxID=2059880 RepID=A0A2H5BLB2_9CAUD|nr:hypothetical protein HOS57_gp25 [Streptomyces phage AbbeyMikolon]AUG87097.1 hypothetical protein SEA_ABBEYMIKOLON_25 [Streptomyces phage AbbeyMikolon]
MFGSRKTPEEKAEATRLRNLRISAGVLGIRVVDDGATFRIFGQNDVPVAGARVTVDRGEAAKRITATRVALTGVFALALKKDNTKLFITVEGADGSALITEVSAGKEMKARTFATMVNGGVTKE